MMKDHTKLLQKNITRSDAGSHTWGLGCRKWDALESAAFRFCQMMKF